MPQIHAAGPDGTVVTLDQLSAWALALPPSAGAATVLAVDGPSGSGKSTLAGALGTATGAPVVQMDDLYPGWDGLADAVPRLVEGVASGSLACAPYLAGIVWVEAEEEERFRRGIERDSETYLPHWQRWALQEAAHFARERTRDRADAVLESDAAPRGHRVGTAWINTRKAPAPTDRFDRVTSFALRAIDPYGPHVRPFLELARLAFKDSTPISDEMIEVRRPVYAQQDLTGAFDGDTLVGTFRTWPTRLTVPGDPRRDVPATAVSTVAVLPTHTRRGILTALMRRHLDKAASDGSAAAVLIASEAVIYGRFGFGPATESAEIEVDLLRARMRPEVPDPGGVSYASDEELRTFAPEVFEAARTPGEIDRPAWWWDYALDGQGAAGGGKRRARLLRRAPDGTADGYLVYEFTDEWAHRVPKSQIKVRNFRAAGPDAYIALWRYLFSIDTVATLTADPRPLDEPISAMLADSRALHRRERSDLLWLRLFDVPAFFGARGYSPGTTGTVVFEVDDPLGYASGRFELSVDGAGRGECRPCPDGAAQLRLPVDVLSSAALGGGDLAGAHLAGRLTELEAGASSRLAVLLHSVRPPYNGTWF